MATVTIVAVRPILARRSSCSLSWTQRYTNARIHPKVATLSALRNSYAKAWLSF